MNEPENKQSVSHSPNLAEITIKAVVLGVVLSVVLAAANAYLGLFAGMTVSASIPAAVVSMGVLRLFRRSNILENNIVQTAASAGESLAAGVIFTLPALVIMGYSGSDDFDIGPMLKELPALTRLIWIDHSFEEQITISRVTQTENWEIYPGRTDFWQKSELVEISRSSG